MIALQTLEQIDAILDSVPAETLRALSDRYQPAQHSGLSVEDYLNSIGAQMQPYYEQFFETDTPNPPDTHTIGSPANAPEPPTAPSFS